MALRSTMAKKVPLLMVMRGTRVVGSATPFSKSGAAVRPFSSIENSYKKLIADYDWGRIAARIDYLAQKVEKIEQQLHQLQPQQSILEQMKMGDGGSDAYDYGCNFNYIPPVYHDPKLPQFYAIAQRAINTYNLSQVSKLELLKVALAFTNRGEDNTRIVIEAKPCNAATDSDSQPQVIYEGVILSKDEKFEELVPIKPAKNLDKNDHQSEVFIQQNEGGKSNCEQKIDNDKSSRVCGFQTNMPPVYHDPKHPSFARVAQRAIQSYNLAQHYQDSKLELIKVNSAYTKGDDKTRVVIKARTCNTPGSQPVIYKGIVSFKDQKLEELIPMVPDELKL